MKNSLPHTSEKNKIIPLLLSSLSLVKYFLLFWKHTKLISVAVKEAKKVFFDKQNRPKRIQLTVWHVCECLTSLDR